MDILSDIQILFPPFRRYMWGYIIFLIALTVITLVLNITAYSITCWKLRRKYRKVEFISNCDKFFEVISEKEENQKQEIRSQIFPNNSSNKEIVLPEDYACYHEFVHFNRFCFYAHHFLVLSSKFIDGRPARRSVENNQKNVRTCEDREKNDKNESQLPMVRVKQDMANDMQAAGSKLEDADGIVEISQYSQVTCPKFRPLCNSRCFFPGMAGQVNISKQLLSKCFEDWGTIHYVKSSNWRKLDEINSRMKARTGEVGWLPYINNCEHYTNFVLTGDHRSDQIQDNEGTWYSKFSILFLLNGLGFILPKLIYGNCYRILLYLLRSIVLADLLHWGTFGIFGKIVMFWIIVSFEIFHYLFMIFIDCILQIEIWRKIYHILKDTMYSFLFLTWLIGGTFFAHICWDRDGAIIEAAFALCVYIIAQCGIVAFVGAILDSMYYYLNWKFKEILCIFIVFLCGCFSGFSCCVVCSAYYCAALTNNCTVPYRQLYNARWNISSKHY